MPTTRFYGDLKAFRLPLTELLREKNFTPMPDDWHVVIADIRNSTGAVAAGTHNDVNLVAAGSLIAGLNVAKKHNIEIPFFFGGDGGNLLVPDEMLRDVLAALHAHNRNATETFGLAMHVGSVSMSEVRKAGHEIRLAKLQHGNAIPKAVLIGRGLLWAEQLVKKETAPVAETGLELSDMTGLECRWDRVKPPQSESRVVCYLIEVCDPAKEIDVYREVLQKADELFGKHEMRNPLSAQNLKLLVSVNKMRKEMLARFGRMRRFFLLNELMKTSIGKLALRLKLKIADFRGKTYLQEVISNADTLTLDGRINMIVSNTEEQRKSFINYLNDLESKKILRYGHHVNNESVMTCYIAAREEKHVHFVDGGDGGYTAAAGELKRKAC